MRAGVRRGLATVAVLAVLVAGGVVMTRWVQQRQERMRCEALGADVEGMGPIRWDNGFTSSGPAWVNALTDGVEHADEPTRAALAEAVRADADGLREFRDAMGDHSAPKRLRAMLIDPDGPQARRTDVVIQRDIATVRRAAVECGFV